MDCGKPILWIVESHQTSRIISAVFVAPLSQELDFETLGIIPRALQAL